MICLKLTFRLFFILDVVLAYFLFYAFIFIYKFRRFQVPQMGINISGIVYLRFVGRSAVHRVKYVLTIKKTIYR